MRRFTLAIIVFMLTAVGQGSSQTPLSKRPLTFEDMMALKRISGPAISPDGRWVLFAAVDVDLKANKRTSHLWVVPLAGGESRQVTSDPAGETGGRSEEHTSELQSHLNLLCRLLLAKKKRDDLLLEARYGRLAHRRRPAS